MYATCSIALQPPVVRDRLGALLASLPDGILRAKGFVYLADDPNRLYVLQLVGPRWKLIPGVRWGSDEPQTKLVFIGLPGSFSPAELKQRLLDAAPLPSSQGCHVAP